MNVLNLNQAYILLQAVNNGFRDIVFRKMPLYILSTYT